MPARPFVLVTTGRRAAAPHTPVPGRVRPPRPEVHLAEPLIDAIVAAGGQPLLLPPVLPDVATLAGLLERVDAVVISGGAFDIHPRHYGQDAHGRLDAPDDDRTGLELALVRAALDLDLPLLGLCGGMQAMAVATGGSLIQDIATELPASLPHEQAADPALPSHPVDLSPGRLRELLGPTVPVNSTHHQAVADPGVFTITGRAPDGVVEAIELPGHRFAVGVQWHPELLGQGALFAGVVRR